jgi:Zn-finger nucleic acid-binding protein
MLLACQDCHRVYDVKDLAAGKKVRCTCGTLNTVTRPAPVERVMAHCGSCGGALPADSKTCSYCQARVSLLDERLGEPCPHCVVRLPLDARFCSGCGRSVMPTAVVQALSDSDCPVCAEGLRVVTGSAHPFHQCSTCGGLWLSRDALDTYVEEMKGRPSTPAERREIDHSVRLERRLKQNALGPPCPVCRTHMFRHEFARYSGVGVDQCRAHGWWLDAGELERIGTFVRADGLEQVDRRERARRASRSLSRLWKARIAAERRRDSDGLWMGILGQMLSGD